MLVLAGFAFVAGTLTILAPCTLPRRPARPGGVGDRRRRRRTLGVLIGFGLAFVSTAVLLASDAGRRGPDHGPTAPRERGGPRARRPEPRRGSAVGRGRSDSCRRWPVSGHGWSAVGGGDGLAGGLVLGAAIGLVWAPCVGPIMAGVIAAAATQGPTFETVVVALAYVAGVALPLALIASWGRRASDRMGSAARRGTAPARSRRRDAGDQRRSSPAAST